VGGKDSTGKGIEFLGLRQRMANRPEHNGKMLKMHGTREQGDFARSPSTIQRGRAVNAVRGENRGDKVGTSCNGVNQPERLITENGGKGKRNRSFPAPIENYLEGYLGRYGKEEEMGGEGVKWKLRN